MKITRFTLAIIVISISAYSFITDRYELLPLGLLVMGVMLLIMGISEFCEQRRIVAIFAFLAAGFSIFVAIYTF